MANKQGIISQLISGSAYIATGRIRESWDETIYKLNISKSPLLLLLNKMKKREVDQMKFNWMTKQRKSDWVTVTAVAGNWSTTAADDGTFTVATTDAYLFAATDLIIVPEIDKDQVIYVDSTVQSTGVITAHTVADGTIDMTGLVGKQVFIMSSANDKYSGLGTIKSQQPSELYNYIQILQTPMGITQADMAAGYRGGSEWEIQIEEAAIDHAFKIEKTLFFGQRNADLSSHSSSVYEAYETGGVMDFLSTNVSNIAGALTKQEFSDWVDDWVKYAEQPIIFAGDLIYGGLSRWQQEFVRIDQKETVLGLAVNTFMTNKGKKISVVPHSELLCDGFAGYAFGLDIKDLAYVYFKGLDTHLEKEIQQPDLKIREDEFRTYFGLQINNEKKHGLLYGVTDISLA